MKRAILVAGIAIVSLLLVASPAIGASFNAPLKDCNPCSSYILKYDTGICGDTIVLKCYNSGQNRHTCECHYAHCYEESYYG